MQIFEFKASLVYIAFPEQPSYGGERLQDAGDAIIVGNLQGKLLMESGTCPREGSVIVNKTERSWSSEESFDSRQIQRLVFGLDFWFSLSLLWFLSSLLEQ